MNVFIRGITTFLLVILSTFIWIACEQSAVEPEDPDTTVPSVNDELPEIFAHFSDDVNIYIDGEFVVLESNGLPNHPSPYFEQGSDLYEAYNGDNSNFHLNPNRIEENYFTFRIPLHPEEANNKSATPMGSIGIAVNGVSFFNQYAAGNAPLTNEINSFDQYAGHPQNTGVYHYHIEPLYLTSNQGKEAFLGFLLDGFPVYGPQENGERITNNDLDEYHGHFGVTTDYPDGIYHYHITEEDPYLNGSGFFGNAGSVSR